MITRFVVVIWFVSLLLLFGVCVCSPTQAPSTNGQWPCGGDVAFLKDQRGNPVWIAFEDLKQHATNAPIPQTPSPFRTSARVTVDVLIGVDGRVKCLRVSSAHPTLQLAAARAAEQWRFEPFVAGVHPVAVFGYLEFIFGQ